MISPNAQACLGLIAACVSELHDMMLSCHWVVVSMSCKACMNQTCLDSSSTAAHYLMVSKTQDLHALFST